MISFPPPLFPLALLLKLPVSYGWGFLLLSFGLGLGVGLIGKKYGRLGHNIATPQFQSLFEFAPIGMAQISLQGTVLQVNPALCNLLECETEQLLDHPFTDWIHPLERESFARYIQHLITVQTPITEAEQRCLSNSGRLVHTILSAHLRQDSHGQPQSVFLALQDISTRKQIELALQEQKQYLRLIIDNIPQQVFWKDTNSIFLGCNKHWAAAAGLAHPDEVVGKTDFDLLPDPKVAEYYRIQDRVIIETNRPELHTVASKERLGEDGQVVWLDINRVPIHDQEGQVVGVLGVLEDITQRRQAVEAIRESEALLNATFSQAAIGIAHQNEAGCCLKVNQRYCDIFGYSAQALLALSFQGLSYPADLEPDATQYQALWAGEISTYTLEKRCIRQDGQTIWCNKTVSLTYDAQGIPRYATVILEDISDRIQAAIELQKAKDSAEQANRAKSDFLAKMSHELRTPLNAILGFTQLLQRQVNLTAPQQEHLGIINRSGEHLLTLINDILDLSKIEARRMPINPNPFDLDQFLTRLDEMLRLRAETHGLQLHIERASEIPRYVSTDEGKLRQVLINLLGNALKFTVEGEVRLIVVATVVGHQDALSFTIADTGVGIPTHEIPQLFAPFEQTTSGEATGQGTGLGLAISQQFVRLMGGEITVQSVVGKGSQFAFTIPVQRCQANDLSPGTTNPQVLHLVPNQPEYRLLVVDDSLEHCHALGELLLDVGFTVKIATEGLGALHLWRTFDPHLVWMDAQMPEIDGYEVTRQIRAVELTEHLTPTKIIALTARVFEADRSLALAAGCDDFVQKPFDETTILTKLSEHLGVNYCYGQPSHSYSEHSRSELPESEPNILLTTAQREQFQTALHQMPTAWREALQIAAYQCDHTLVLPLVTEMPGTAQLLQKYLLHCLEQYRFDHIVDLFEGALAVRS